MKKIILILVLGCTYVIGSCQIQSSCNAPQILLDEYDRDIKNLTLRRLYEISSSDTASVRIPQAHQDTIIDGLAAIFNATSIPERDSVFNLYCVHDAGINTTYHSYLIEIDTLYSWTNAWKNLITTTGNTYIDSITAKYHLTVTEYYNWSAGTYVQIQTDSLWSPMALIHTLTQEPGVLSGSGNNAYGGSGTIGYDFIGNDKYYYFYFQYNDCFAGCSHYRSWSFRVDANCSVSYLGFSSWGFPYLPLPAPLDCNTFTPINDIEQTEEYLLFPNPVSNVLALESNHYTEDKVYSIIDPMGHVITSGVMKKDKTTINVNHLLPGCYFIQINSGEYTTSFLKL